VKRQARASIREGVEVAERAEVLPHALVVQPLRHVAELLVRDLPGLRHQAELVRPVVVVVEAIRLLPPGRGDLPGGALSTPELAHFTVTHWPSISKTAGKSLRRAARLRTFVLSRICWKVRVAARSSLLR
jgi:hypothetical protein